MTALFNMGKRPTPLVFYFSGHGYTKLMGRDGRDVRLERERTRSF